MKKLIYPRTWLVWALLVLFHTSCGGGTNKESADNEGAERKAPAAAAQAWDVAVYGLIQTPGEGQITISQIINNQPGKPEAITLNGDNTYRKVMNISNPGYYQINYFGMQTVTLILDKSDVEINWQGTFPRAQFTISGSPDADLINEVQAMSNTANMPEMQALEVDFQQAVARKDNAQIQALREKAQGLVVQNEFRIVSHLKVQPASLALAYLLQGNTFQDKDKHIDLYINAADKIIRAYPTSAHALEFMNLVNRMKKIAVGRPAPEIALPDPNGNVVKLSSFRGKYVLIDFWAKWCGPCRMENPNVVSAYKKFKDKGFEVFGVSLDRNKQDWVQAIKEDGITFTQVSDLKYFNNAAAVEYNVAAIPYSILLDKEGTIIAKNLRGPALHQKLAEVLGE